MGSITIGVATHKKYEMPDDDMYLPIHSGAVLSRDDFGYQKDSEKDNISEKNLNYCELTALYWLWKNNNSEYKGLTHYRRHFSNRKYHSALKKGKFEDILHEKKSKRLLSKNDIILPQKRKYIIETIRSHYEHTHNANDLSVTEKVIEDLCPEYLENYHSILKKRSAHMFNMFVMSREKFDEYCNWLFLVLFEVEKRLDISDYNQFHSRVFGRLSEFLLDVWIEKNNYSYVEAPAMFMEKQCWFLKIRKFLNAKFKGIKY